MIKTIINAFKIQEIRKKLLFTAFIILIFRIGSVIPVPFVNIVDEIDVGKGNTIMTYLSLMAVRTAIITTAWNTASKPVYEAPLASVASKLLARR